MTTLATSRKYYSTKAHIKCHEIVKFVHWMAHSLNLIGMCADDCYTAAVTMFSTIQRLYVYPVKSIYRWHKHRDVLKHVPIIKCLSDTQWWVSVGVEEALTNGFQQNITVQPISNL